LLFCSDTDVGGDAGKAPVAQQETEETSPNEETKVAIVPDPEQIRPFPGSTIVPILYPIP